MAIGTGVVFILYLALNAFFLLMDKPETYNLPNTENAKLPSRNNVPGYLGGAVTAVAGLLAGVLAFRSARMSGTDRR